MLCERRWRFYCSAGLVLAVTLSWVVADPLQALKEIEVAGVGSRKARYAVQADMSVKPTLFKSDAIEVHCLHPADEGPNDAERIGSIITRVQWLDADNVINGADFHNTSVIHLEGSFADAAAAHGAGYSGNIKPIQLGVDVSAPEEAKASEDAEKDRMTIFKISSAEGRTWKSSIVAQKKVQISAVVETKESEPATPSQSERQRESDASSSEVPITVFAVSPVADPEITSRSMTTFRAPTLVVELIEEKANRHFHRISIGHIPSILERTNEFTIPELDPIV